MNTDINKYIYIIYICMQLSTICIHCIHDASGSGLFFFSPGLPGDSLGQSAKLLVAMAMAMAWYRNDQ